MRNCASMPNLDFVGKLAELWYRYSSLRMKPEEIMGQTDARYYEALRMGEAVKRLGQGGLEAAYTTESGLNIRNAGDREPADPEAQALQALAARADQREAFTRLTGQARLERVLQIAASSHDESEPVSDEEVDPDWATRFFRFAEDASTEEMQFYWGKVLAGEVKQPGSFSLRALAILHTITREEAHLFQPWAQRCIWSWPLSAKHSGFVMRTRPQIDGDLDWPSLRTLDSVGLMHENESAYWYLRRLDTPVKVIFRYGKKVIAVERPADTPQSEMSIYMFTREGVQLSMLVEPHLDPDYLQRFVNAQLVGPNVRVIVGDYVGEPGGRIRYNNLVTHEAPIS
jgi:hypothetical protein